MTMPAYVPPELLMRDRADFARKGIARGRSVMALCYDQGILLAADNPSRTLHKIGEIYDRIAFAGAGKYHEFEALRIAGIRYADLRGFTYAREDVTARALAHVYAQTLGAVFTQDMKPFEVELVVAGLGTDPSGDQLFRLTYDGSVADEHGYTVIGGAAEQLSERVSQRWRAGMSRDEALDLARSLLAAATQGAGSPGVQPPAPDTQDATTADPGLEVAVLERSGTRRTFRRLTGAPSLASPAPPTSPGD